MIETIKMIVEHDDGTSHEAYVRIGKGYHRWGSDTAHFGAAVGILQDMVRAIEDQAGEE